jgi:serine/threonine protein phosphatase PrpC
VKWIQQWVATSASPTHPERNEDNWWIARSNQAAAVIDGMGGYRRTTAEGEVGGEHASALAAQVLAERLDDWDRNASLDESRGLLREAIEAVNSRIWEELNHSGVLPPDENPEGKSIDDLSVGVAMTVIVLCDGGSRALLGQHGDTQGYVMKEMGLIKVTEDQDLLTWERITNQISEEEAAAISQALDHFDGTTLSEMPDERAMRYFFDRNIYGALGVSDDCPEPGWSVIKLAPGDRIALLSDGAHSNMSVDELASLLAYPDDPADVILELAQQRSLLPRFPDPNDPGRRFNMRATQDDITVVVLDVGEADSDPEGAADGYP